MTTPAHTLAKALAMALLADAHTGPGARTAAALAARAGACLGPEPESADAANPAPASNPPPGLPAMLREQLRRLSQLPAREWARMQAEDLATWLVCGRWRRMAGVATQSPGLIPDAPLDDELSLDALFDEAPSEPFPTLPPERQSDTQLARAFCDWVRQTHAQPRHWLLRPAQPGPQPIWLDEHTWGSRAVPRWATAADVAQALDLNLDELLWLAPAHAHWRERAHADPREHAHSHPRDSAGLALPPSHYRHRLVPKRSGGLRLLEAPRPRLAQAQRRLLDLALAAIPVHEAAHGFVRGRGVASHVAKHAGQAVVVRFDLRDFFTQVNATRVRALWRALGHSRAVADLLTRLTTTRTPAAVRERLLEAMPHPEDTAGTGEAARAIAQRRARDQALARAHLPQGAPTSPAIANLCAFGLDLRLAALARRFGARYSRYADDLVFSGPQDLRRQWPGLRAWIAAIVQAEGFALRADKTRLMPAHQRQLVTGVVLNTRPNLPRAQFDLLKARLHRLSLQAAVPQTERARLQGQLQWARQWLAPSRAARLQALFDAIRFAN